MRSGWCLLYWKMKDSSLFCIQQYSTRKKPKKWIWWDTYQLVFIPHFISDLIFVTYLQEARKAKFSLSQNDLWEVGKHIGGKLSYTNFHKIFTKFSQNFHKIFTKFSQNFTQNFHCHRMIYGKWGSILEENSLTQNNFLSQQNLLQNTKF